MDAPDTQAPEVWRVIYADGAVCKVAVLPVADGFCAKRDGLPSRFARTPHAAVISVDGVRGWDVAEVLRPGEASRAELAERAAVLAATAERAEADLRAVAHGVLSAIGRDADAGAIARADLAAYVATAARLAVDDLDCARGNAVARAERAEAEVERLTRALGEARLLAQPVDPEERLRFLLSLDAAKERDALLARRERAEAERDEALRRVRVVLSHFGVADCDDPLAALEEVPDRADAVVGDEVARANELAMELDALRAIVEGRTTPPTDAELEAHNAAGGEWLVREYTPAGMFSASSIDDPERAKKEAARPSSGHRWRRWWAIGANGIPCAWPVAMEAPDAR